MELIAKIEALKADLRLRAPCTWWLLEILECALLFALLLKAEAKRMVLRLQTRLLLFKNRRLLLQGRVFDLERRVLLLESGKIQLEVAQPLLQHGTEGDFTKDVSNKAHLVSPESAPTAAPVNP